MGKRLLAGFGNYIKGDDGIGLVITEYIQNHGLEKGFEIIYIGNDGMTFLSYLTEDIEKILVVDCALMGFDAGEYALFSPEEVESKKMLQNISTHESDVIKLIEMAKKLGQKIPSIKLLAIEPQSMNMGDGISETLQKRLDEYVKVAISEIQN